MCIRDRTPSVAALGARGVAQSATLLDAQCRNHGVADFRADSERGTTTLRPCGLVGGAQLVP
eukprot:3223066-Alexandrium_andersonii.AAC.1